MGAAASEDPETEFYGAIGPQCLTCGVVFTRSRTGPRPRLGATTTPPPSLAAVAAVVCASRRRHVAARDVEEVPQSFARRVISEDVRGPNAHGFKLTALGGKQT